MNVIKSHRLTLYCTIVAHQLFENKKFIAKISIDFFLIHLPFKLKRTLYVKHMLCKISHQICKE